MAGTSPGLGCPGRGYSPGESQVSRPKHGGASGGPPAVLLSEGKDMDGSNGGGRNGGQSAKSVSGNGNVCDEKSRCESGREAAKIVEQVEPHDPVLQPNPRRSQQSGAQGGGEAAGARRCTRSSVEPKIQQQQQQQVMAGSSPAHRLRDRLQTKRGGGSSTTQPQPAPVTQVTASGDSNTQPPHVPATQAKDSGKRDEDEFKRPAVKSAPKQKGAKRAPELHLADRIPGLVKRLETQQKTKLKIQMQIDSVYGLKTANPKKEILYNSKLDSLSAELAGVVKDIESVLDELGPVGEVYRNRDRFAAGNRQRTESSSESDSGDHKTTIPLKERKFQQKERDSVPVISQRPPEGSNEQLQSGTVVPDVDLALEGSRETGLAQEAIAAEETPSGDMQESRHTCANNQGIADITNNGAGIDDAGVVEWSQSELPENGEMEVSAQNNPLDFPPLVSQSVTTDGNGVGSDRVPPRSAWSRGAPSFPTSASYTGQAFKRRNVVRFKNRGQREELPDRKFVIRELLCHQMGFVPAEILAVINLPDRQGYDVSFKLMADLDRFWANYSRFREAESWKSFSLVPISKPDTVNVNIIFWNESVPPQDIVVWLRRHCEMVSDLTKNKDSDGVWTGGWRVLVKLQQHNNVTHHLPNSFFIGRERGACFYAGQPRLCFKCGKTGHVANVCSVIKCSLCGENGHVSSTCEKVKCNLCGRLGHFHRHCPEAFHNVEKELADEELVAAADQVEEEALMSGTILTRQEVVSEAQETSPVQKVSTQQAEEQRPVSRASSVAVSASVESASSGGKKRNKKSTSTRRPESDWTLVQKPVKKVKGTPDPGIASTSNRYEVLSESDADSYFLDTLELEQELKRVERECDAESEDDPPTKRRPPPGPALTESDMEVSGRQNDSDSDL